MRRINIILFTILISCTLAACSATSPTEDTRTEAEKEVTRKKIRVITQRMMTFNHQITLPPKPDLEHDRMTVAGVDADRNGTRDYLQHISAQMTWLLTEYGITVEHYHQVLDLLNMIQPPAPPVPNSIDEHKIYCAYQALPSIIKDENSLQLMYMIVLNSQKRKSNFYDSIKPSVRHLEEEPCD